MQDDILPHHARLQFAFEPEMHRLRHLDQQFACAEHEAGVGVPDPGGELVERPRHARMRVGPEQHLARPRVALLRQRRVAHAGVMQPVLALEIALGRVEYPVPIRVINHVIEISDPLRLHKVPQDVHVAVRLGIRREDVMVRHDDHFVAVPHFRRFAELALEHPDRARSAHVMRHQDIGLHPNIVTGLDPRLAGRAGQYFLSQSHTAPANYLTGPSRSMSIPAP